jgi:hypothetical protein
MSNLKVEVPLLIMILQIMMKLVVHRRASLKSSLEIIYELPTNFIFLSISFSIVFIFLKEPIKSDAVILFIKLVIAAIIVVAIFRECKYLADSSLTNRKKLFLVLLILINFLISVNAIFKASDQLLKNPIDTTEQIQNIKETDKCI